MSLTEAFSPELTKLFNSIGSELQYELVEVTPSIAKALLSINDNNRGLNNNRVVEYAKSMKEGNWLLHHQGIAIYDDMTLADGQHRLAAVCKAGVPVQMMVAVNIPKQSSLVIDSGQKRRLHQSIKISGEANWITEGVVSCTRLLLEVNNEIEKGSSGCHFVSHNDIINEASKYRSSLEFGLSMKTKKKESAAVYVLLPIGIASKYEDHERLNQFYSAFRDGLISSPDDKAAILLREFVLKSRSRFNGSVRKQVVKRVMRAIKAFCDRDQIGKLYQPEYYVYTPKPD